MQPVETTNPPNPPSSDRTVLWIVGGVIALCLCAAVGVVAIAGAFMFLNSSSISSGDLPIFAATATEETEQVAVGVTLDIADGGTDHVTEGTPVDYTSNPPSSGSHYGQWLETGFYDVTVSDGYVVHSLEHGYVIIWYNCDDLSDSECTSLENDIADLVDDLGYKVIGMNRTGNIPTVIALTSWGKLAYLDSFDEAFIRDFYSDNLENSPEPEAP